MKKVSFVLLVSLVSSIVNAQIKCNIEELTNHEKILLNSFWNELKSGIQTKNKQQIASICNFSMSCSLCNSNEKEPHTLLLNKKEFYNKHYKIFFTKNLFEIVSKNRIFDILSGEHSNSSGCIYNIGFPIIKPSKNWEGLQGFFSIKKVKNKYKIISIWSVP